MYRKHCALNYSQSESFLKKYKGYSLLTRKEIIWLHKLKK